jgi:hypothetical protein
LVSGRQVKRASTHLAGEPKESGPDFTNKLFRIACENLFSAEFVECDDLIRPDCTPRDLHAGRANGHSRDGHTYDIGPFGYETLYLSDRYMSLDDVAIHDGCVATLEFSRYLVPGFYLREITYVLGFYTKPVFFQIITPCATAAFSIRAA